VLVGRYWRWTTTVGPPTRKHRRRLAQLRERWRWNERRRGRHSVTREGLPEAHAPRTGHHQVPPPVDPFSCLGQFYQCLGQPGFKFPLFCPCLPTPPPAHGRTGPHPTYTHTSHSSPVTVPSLFPAVCPYPHRVSCPLNHTHTHLSTHHTRHTLATGMEIQVLCLRVTTTTDHACAGGRRKDVPPYLPRQHASCHLPVAHA